MRKAILPASVAGDCVLLLSGGMDSTVALAKLVRAGRRPMCLIFDYGQTLRGEIAVAVANAERYGVPHRVVKLDLGWTAPACSILGDGSEIAKGRSRAEIAVDGTPSSYVPFRNGIFLSIAAAYAEGHGLSELFCGGNGLDSGNYWDDTHVFAAAMQAAIQSGTDPYWDCRVEFPLSRLSKARVAEVGLSLGVDFSKTTSCYAGESPHCGVCDSCVQRAAALAGIGLDIEGAAK